MHPPSRCDKLTVELYDGQGAVSETVVGSLPTYGRDGSFLSSLLFEEGGGSMGLYEIVSLVFQAATLLVGILALCDSRKK